MGSFLEKTRESPSLETISGGSEARIRPEKSNTCFCGCCLGAKEVERNRRLCSSSASPPFAMASTGRCRGLFSCVNSTPLQKSSFLFKFAVFRPYNPCNLGLATYWDGWREIQGDKGAVFLNTVDPCGYRIERDRKFTQVLASTWKAGMGCAQKAILVVPGSFSGNPFLFVGINPRNPNAQPHHYGQ